jgi:3-hydroxyacyl-CoA dehydrogenase/enoyl-CoA hydratase/3-hydroxybutyryl-CoA epimerase
MTIFKTANLQVERDGDFGRLWLDVQDRPFNVFGRQVLADMHAALDAVEAEPGIKYLFFGSKKPSGFLAGADIQEFTTIKTAAEAMEMTAAGQKLMNRVANLRIPTRAVIYGPCLGGGLEFALACDYRSIIDLPSTQVGLPEIELGLVPGWGGTQRLPRVIGLEPALQVILQRKRLNAREAKAWGLVDTYHTRLDDAECYIEKDPSRLTQKRPKAGLPLRTWRQKLLESTPIGRMLILRTAAGLVKAKTPEDMPAPAEALECIRIGLSQGIEAGLKREREAIGRLATTNASRNLVTIFFLMMNAKKTEKGEGEEKKPFKKVGVVGAGTMGAGIAQLALVKGYDVVVQEVNDAALAAGMKKIEDLLNKAAERRVLSAEDVRQKMAAIGRTTKWEGFENVDVAIEAAIEDLEKKRALFQAMDERCRPDAILATNTSSLSVKQLQEGLKHPERLAGLHFFNPVHKMPLVEVVRTPATEERVISLLVQFAASAGKTPVVCSDSPGFIVNRILTPYLNEAGVLLGEGLPVEAIDRTMKKFGMPMGPLELLDQVGLDIAAHVSKSVAPAFGDRLTPSPALPRMGEMGCLGQKAGKGFYIYGGKKKQVNTEALTKLATELGMKMSDGKVSPERVREARERMVLLMVNEAAMCLSEGLAERADVVDLAMVFGTGWAPHRGGPLRYADDRGVADVIKTLEQLARKHGPRFEPCQELRRRAESRELFYSTLPALKMAG